MRLPWRSQRPRVRIGNVREGAGYAFTAGHLYELTPVSYAGPWTLPEGTVLEVVSIPKKSNRKKSP